MEQFYKTKRETHYKTGQLSYREQANSQSNVNLVISGLGTYPVHLHREAGNEIA